MFNKNASIQTHIAFLQNTIVNYEKRMTDMITHHTKTTDTNKVLEDEIKELKNTYENRIQELQEHIKQVEDNIQSLTTTNNSLVIYKKELETVLEQQIAKISAIEPDYTEMKMLLSNLKIENNILTQKIKEKE